MNVINSDMGSPIFSWCPDVEEKARQQIGDFADLPFVTHAALMPDAHAGMSLPIGGVVACQGVVIPDAVGVDIGCGMCAVQTDLRVEQLTKEIREDLLHRFHRTIPVGFSHNSDKRKDQLAAIHGDKFTENFSNCFGNKELGDYLPIGQMPDIYNAFFAQLGTLGGGNHFIEVQKDQDGLVWVMIHSGSRNIGKRICEWFNEIAADRNQQWLSNSPVAFLPTQSSEGQAYLSYMNFALKFAYLNRAVMMDGLVRDIKAVFPGVMSHPLINIHHNYANLEHHFGKDVWVHRKGATLASDKTTGIIPGSMGTNSYIVKGLNNEKSLRSCSHGAGRRMGRKEFNRQNNTPEKLQAIKDQMKDITFDGFGMERSFKKNKGNELVDVSESAGAYKDIDQVMENQKDLVEIVTRLSPLIAMKDKGEE